jgi:biotin carboxyl carrier protein
MSDEQPLPTLVQRVRDLAELFVETDLLRLRIDRDGGHIELGRRAHHPALAPEIAAEPASTESAPVRADQIKADLVGIFHFSRPMPSEGEVLESDRELAFIEALGIRNPVRSRGAGRILSIKRADGDAVEYGAVLFDIDRG